MKLLTLVMISAFCICAATGCTSLMPNYKANTINVNLYTTNGVPPIVYVTVTSNNLSTAGAQGKLSYR